MRKGTQFASHLIQISHRQRWWWKKRRKAITSFWKMLWMPHNFIVVNMFTQEFLIIKQIRYLAPLLPSTIIYFFAHSGGFHIVLSQCLRDCKLMISSTLRCENSKPELSHCNTVQCTVSIIPTTKSAKHFPNEREKSRQTDDPNQ